MFHPPTDDIRTARADGSIDPDVLTSAIRDADWPGDALIYKDREDGTVCRRTLAGRDLVLKTEPIASGYRRLQVRLGLSRGRRAWDGAAWLIAHDVPTATPIALLDGTAEGCRVECLVLPALDGVTLLEHLADAPGDTDALGDAVGRDIAAMFLGGRYNRDHKPSNLIVHPTEPRASIIDTVAIRRIDPGLEPLVRMLASLTIEPTQLDVPDVWVFVERVAGAAAAGLLADGIDAERYTDRLLTLVRERVDQHDGPRPRHDTTA